MPPLPEGMTPAEACQTAAHLALFLAGLVALACTSPLRRKPAPGVWQPWKTALAFLAMYNWTAKLVLLPLTPARVLVSASGIGGWLVSVLALWLVWRRETIWMWLSWQLCLGSGLFALYESLEHNREWPLKPASAVSALAQTILMCALYLVLWLDFSAKRLSAAFPGSPHGPPTTHAGSDSDDEEGEGAYLLAAEGGGRAGKGLRHRSIQSGPGESTPLLERPRPATPARPNYTQAISPGLSQEEQAGPLSRLLFHWVDPFIVFGHECVALANQHLLKMPQTLFATSVSKMFLALLDAGAARPEAAKPKPGRFLLRTFNKAFGWEYYPLGLLRLLADLAGFAGPIFLNKLVNFIENSTEKVSNGYLYAGLLSLSALLGAALNTQYNFQVNKVQIRLRTAVVSSVYTKSLSARLVARPVREATREDATGEGEEGQDDSGSTGAILNLMSTDCDRVANFCPSFHQFWSLPFQIAVCLYLLYLQVGMAFLAGLVFAILLIPLNRKIAMKIGALSSSMMAAKDTRVKVVNEVLQGISIVKFYGWELQFLNRITSIRKKELRSLRGRKYLDALCVYLWATTPVIISILTFGTYVLINKRHLTAATVFTSIALFNILIGPLNAFPWVLNGLMEAWVSLRRIEEYIRAENRTELAVLPPPQGPGEPEAPHPSPVLEMRAADFTWGGAGDAAAATHLKAVSLRLLAGDFVCVVGPVGSGKSTLLAAILGELHQTAGSAALARGVHDQGVGYFAQEAWVQNTTIRNNILCGAGYDPDLYSRVIRCCCLTSDLEVLPAGDETIAGENGASLSGGQKARVALARCLYHDAPLYLLDDPLAALDATVANEVLQEAILGFLKGKARLLCTHNAMAIQKADRVYLMDDGKLVEWPRHALPAPEDTGKAAGRGCDTDKDDMAAPDGIEAGEEDSGLSKEGRSLGVVRLEVYMQYWHAVGSVLAGTVFLSLLLMQASRNGSDLWLSNWVTHAIKHKSDDGGGTRYYLKVYAAISLGNTLLTLLRAFSFAYAGLKAARTLHERLARAVLLAPMWFFDQNPVGRILNRFSSDVFGIDDSLPFIMNILLANAFGLLGTIFVTTYGLPKFILFLLPLSVLYYRVQRYYRRTSREVKRLQSMSRSPVYEHFSETLTGAVTIRSLGRSQGFSSTNLAHQHLNNTAIYSENAAGQWLSVRLQGMGVGMVMAVAFLGALQHHIGHVQPGLVGLSLSYALSVTGLLQGLVTTFTETEKEMVAVERVEEYMTTPAEEQDDAEPRGPGEGPHTRKPPHSTAGRGRLEGWPEAGAVAFENVSLRYHGSSALALDRVSFTAKAGERIGVVGRTGAGKSSLFQALFRMVELDAGRVVIDGVDMQAVPRAVLRSRLAIIPQDPVLFGGTLRDNLDPFEAYSDPAIWTALESCALDELARAMGGLSAGVEERGRNLSVGQRQLVCLGRALLKQSRVLCIDEATANVDHQTDTHIQQTLRERFRGCTVITVAHRIATVLDYDRVIVMDRGRIAEQGAPGALHSQPGSMFRALAEASNALERP